MIDLNRISSFHGDQMGQLKITIAKFYRINGTSTQKLGVSPDITLPSPVDPHEFGESSEQSALPWDQIKSLNYQKFGDLSSVVPKLKQLSENRVENSREFDQIKNDIKEYKIKKEKNYISLNETIRKKEKEENDKKKLDSNENNDEVNLTGDEEIKDDKNEKPDTYLTETGMILTDMIRLKNEVSKIN